MMINTTSARELRAAIAANKPLIAPSVYDGISALAAAEQGFKAVYIGSYATGATRYGVPDTGYISAEDMADQVRRIAPLVRVPIIVDGEGGWGNPLHVAHSVQLLERAGAAAVHIEDHEFGKHIDLRSRVLSLPAAVDKIKAALDARSSEAFMIIGRTDATFALSSQEALARAIAFQEAGADAVFLAGYGFRSDSQWDVVKKEIHIPVFNTDIPGKSAQEMAALGIDIILYYNLSHSVALSAIRSAFSTLASTGSSVGIDLPVPSVAEFDTFLGIEKVREDAHKYGLLG